MEAVQTLVLRPSLAEFEAWNRDSLRKYKTLSKWAVNSLNAYAAGIQLAEDGESDYMVTTNEINHDERH